jgi:nucleobase transporter 1/2
VSFLHAGSEVLDQIIIVLLTTGMFVGGVTAFILDITIPGG